MTSMLNVSHCPHCYEPLRLTNVLAGLAEGDWVGDVLRRYYSRRYFVSTRDGAPFCTMFDCDFFYLPVGEYIAEYDGAQREVKRWGGGYSSGSLPRAQVAS